MRGFFRCISFKYGAYVACGVVSYSESVLTALHVPFHGRPECITYKRLFAVVGKLVGAVEQCMVSYHSKLTDLLAIDC